MTIQVIDANGVKQTILTMNDLMAVVGSTTDAANAAFDATPLTLMQVFKEISKATQATTSPVLQAGTNSIGKVNVQLNGANPDLGAGTGGSATMRVALDSAQFASAGPQIVANSTAVCDSGSGIASTWGVSGAPFTSTDQHSAVASVTDEPTSGQHIVIDDIIVSTDTAMTVTFKEETTGTVIFGPWYVPAVAGPIQITPRGKRKLPTANKAMQVITSVAGNITVQASYHSEA